MYTNTAVIIWVKAAAWLIAIGLIFTVIPRLINLVRVWFSGASPSTARDEGAFFLYLLGIAAAVVNAFVHGRDAYAYAIAPDGLWLSILTVVLIAAANILVTLEHANNRHGVQS